MQSDQAYMVVVLIPKHPDLLKGKEGLRFADNTALPHCQWRHPGFFDRSTDQHNSLHTLDISVSDSVPSLIEESADLVLMPNTRSSTVFVFQGSDELFKSDIRRLRCHLA